jgi:hypothetical protein
MEVLRHRSAASTGPYITDAARLASLAVTMSAATASRPAAAGPDGRHAVGGAAQGRALLLGAESLHDSAEPGPAARCRASPPDSDSPTRGQTSTASPAQPAALFPQLLAQSGSLPGPAGVWPRIFKTSTGTGPGKPQRLSFEPD